jgi:predicted kinase
MCGLPGAGKSTLAKQLEVSLPALRLSPDEWMESVARAAPDDPEARDAVEAAQWRVASRALELGVHVILENGFWTRRDRDAYRALGQECGAKVVLHYLDVPREELLRRLALRYADAPPDGFRITEEMFDLYASWFEPVAAEELA